MLRYLKIFSWLLFTFAIVGLLALVFGLEPTMTSARKAAGLMALQAAISSLILLGFRMNQAAQLPTKVLLYGGWSLIVLLMIVGQIWLNQ